ncbi:hypothetical protein hypothetical protein [Pantoea ananatis AJ13355]|uniref:Uncharacterized protein n=1 Tax=Pantoea ananatis (strain AJ13355) TaxID=932677 RepID=A0A0H3KXZ5_PANAA|nr:hypothetical protein hypothetical protein [Pantoea ananatis AJ13355]
MRYHLAEIARHHLNMITQQGGDDFTTAFKRDIAHFARINTGFFCDQRRFHPVLAADRGTRTHHHFGGIFFHIRHEFAQVFPRRVFTHGNHAVIGADRRQPLHVINRVATKFSLRQVQQRSPRKGHDRTGFGRTLRNDRVIGHRAYATWHVGNAHRLLDLLRFHQRNLNQLTGQVKTAAGFSRCDAFCSVGCSSIT